MGVLFKNAEAIEVLRKVDTLVVDKTGTLTEGKPEAGRVSSAAGLRRSRRCCGWPRASSAAASTRSPRRSSKGAEERGVALARRGRFRVGDRARACADRVDGRARGARQSGADGGRWASTSAPAGDRAEALRADGQTVDVRRGRRQRRPGSVGVADPIKASTPEAIRALHAEGLRIVMLTGDSRTTAEAVARKLGIDEVVAEVLPDQKAEVVKRLPGARAASSRWPATASTTRRRWRRRRSASPWAPAPTSRWRAPA